MSVVNVTINNATLIGFRCVFSVFAGLGNCYAGVVLLNSEVLLMRRTRFGFLCARRFLPGLLLVTVFACFLFLHVGMAHGEEDSQAVPIKVIAMLTKDDQGKQYKFPSQVFYDPTMDEIYVLANRKLNIYNSELYPILSLGAGRGADAPQGGFVDREGRLYLCQGPHKGKPARLTIFNAAFFPVKEIVFADIEGAESFQPIRVAVSQDGIIYLAGAITRGVLVLDNDGGFLRWMRPEDRIYAKVAVMEALAARKRATEKAEALDSEAENVDSDADSNAESNAPYADIPADLLPGSAKEEKEEAMLGVAPVLIKDLVIDSEGHIYLLSEETSKVYVYSASENLLFSFGMKGGSSGKMSRPRALAVDEKKKCVYIVDYMRHTILIYDLAGKFMHEFGGMGSEPGWFNFPCDIALNRRGDIFIADLFNGRVQVLDVQFQVRFPLFGTLEPTVEEGAEQGNVSGVKSPTGGEVNEEQAVPQPEPEIMEESSGSESKTAPLVVEEESLSATGEDSTDTGMFSPDRSSPPAVPDIIEEPIGALPNNMAQ